MKQILKLLIFPLVIFSSNSFGTFIFNETNQEITIVLKNRESINLEPAGKNKSRHIENNLLEQGFNIKFPGGGIFSLTKSILSSPNRITNFDIKSNDKKYKIIIQRNRDGKLLTIYIHHVMD